MSQQTERGLQGTGQHRKENCQGLFNADHAPVSVSVSTSHCSGNDRSASFNFFES